MNSIKEFSNELLKITDLLKQSKYDVRDYHEFMQEQEDTCNNRPGIYIINCLQYFRDWLDMSYENSYDFDGKPDIPMEDFERLVKVRGILTKLEDSVTCKFN